MDMTSLEALLAGEVVKSFPQARAIILWGGLVKQPYVEGRGDVDVAIVLPYEPVEEHSVREKLGELITRFKADHGVELEPAVIRPEQLAASPLWFLVEGGLYKAHGVLQYLLQNQSKVLYGDFGVLATIPTITLDAALTSIAPLLLDKINQIRAELTTSARVGEEIDALQLSRKHLASFLVFARTIFSAKTGRIAGKLQATEYVSAHYPQYASLMRLLSEIYTNDTADLTLSEVTKEEISGYLCLAEEVARKLSQANEGQEEQLL